DSAGRQCWQGLRIHNTSRGGELEAPEDVSGQQLPRRLRGEEARHICNLAVRSRGRGIRKGPGQIDASQECVVFPPTGTELTARVGRQRSPRRRQRWGRNRLTSWIQLHIPQRIKGLGQRRQIVGKRLIRVRPQPRRHSRLVKIETVSRYQPTPACRL